MAQVDEIVDVIQNAIGANYTAQNERNRKEELIILTGEIFPIAQSQLERRGQFMEGNNFTWADLHLFYFCTEDFLEAEIV